jgi:alkylation response protein AidB-like acyl-CoA dehydrogenase
MLYNHADLYSSICYSKLNNMDEIKSLLQQCAKSGILRHAVGSEFGGFGDSFTNLCKQHEDLGYHYSNCSLFLSLNAILWGSIWPLIKHGTSQQKSMYLEPLLSGDIIGGHAITEVHCGSDTSNMRSTAVKTSDGYILNGEKLYITNAGIADIITYYAMTEKGITAFIVKLDHVGVEVSKITDVQTFKNAVLGKITLHDHFVSHDFILGSEGKGAWLMQSALEYERSFVFAGILGALRKVLQEVTEYLCDRQFGDTLLIQKQAISHKIAELNMMLETMRLWVYQCAKLLDNAKSLSLASSYCKIFIGDTLINFTTSLAQLAGAAGLSSKFGLDQLVLDALGSRIIAGTTEIQKNIILSYLGRKGKPLDLL